MATDVFPSSLCDNEECVCVCVCTRPREVERVAQGTWGKEREEALRSLQPAVLREELDKDLLLAPLKVWWKTCFARGTKLANGIILGGQGAKIKNQKKKPNRHHQIKDNI